MDIGFVWDESKYQIVVKKHNVKFYEVVSAFDDPNGFEAFDPLQHEERWLWVGKTYDDRLLIVVYTEQDLPLYRIITAYDAERSWLDEYYQR
ncbi:BrnT family toxin [candidate division KSB1 bacterium]|nr:BrnT family toxin [candidate division KSB1 bacterium]